MTNYAVTCCNKVIALLVDDRPHGPLTILAEPGSTAIIIAARIQIGDEPPYEMPQEQVKRQWGETTVSQTVWEDGHSTWVVRCDHCSKQAVMTEATYRCIADELLKSKAAPVSLLALSKRVAHPGVS